MKESKVSKNIAIVGTGSWGTSVAKAIAETHPDTAVRMWSYEKSVSNSINRKHENTEYLPGVALPLNITATSSLKESLSEASVVLLATPSKVVYETSQKLKKYTNNETVIGYLSKGFCKINHEIFTISQTIEKALPEQKNRVVAVCGPSHAEEVSNRYHTCLNIAGKSPHSRRILAELLSGEYVECRETDDIIGTDVGATLKNPAAIAAGIISVLPYCGDNLSGALISEALKEMIKLGEALNADIDTIIDIAGLGDLVATALSDHSRNRRFGKDIARSIIEKGNTLSVKDKIFLKLRPSTIIEKMSRDLHYLAEGAYAIEPLIELAEEKNIPIPVYRSLYEVLLNKKDPSLLIETIKNPEKFSEIYSNTKIQLTEKQKGLEKVKGNIFHDQIEKGTIDKFIRENKNKEHADSFIADTIRDLKDCEKKMKKSSSGIALEKEAKLIKKLKPENFEKIIPELSKLYVSDVVDNFNPLVNLFFKKLIGLFHIIYRLTGRYKGISVTGEIDEVKIIRDNANLVYVSTYKSISDFIVFVHAISGKNLPFPRFFITRRAVKNRFQSILIKYTGGYIIDTQRLKNPVYKETVCQYISAMIKHGVPILHFPELKPSNDGNILNITDDFFTILKDSLYRNTVEIVLVPVEICYFNKQSNVKDKDKISFKQLKEKTNINFSEPIFLSEFTKESVQTRTLPQLVKDSWINDSPVFPHSILSRVMVENEYSLPIKDAVKEVKKLMDAGSYLPEMKADRVYKKGKSFLKKNNTLIENEGFLKVIEKDDIGYYSNMLPVRDQSAEKTKEQGN